MISLLMPARKRLSLGEIAALCYGDIFDVPVSKKDLSRWAIAGLVGQKFKKTSTAAEYPIKYEDNNEYFFLKGKENLVRVVNKRRQYSQNKLGLGYRIVRLLKHIPSIEAIFITGSVAAGNAKADADIDLMIVTADGNLWLTRALVVIILKCKHIYVDNRYKKDYICPNIFISTKSLSVGEHNLFVAHEVLQAKCLFDRGGVEGKWLKENEWTKVYLPKAYGEKVRITTKIIKRSKSEQIFSSIGFFLWPWEILAFVLQYVYMRPKITNEKIGLHYAFFHPKNLSGEVLTEFEKRIKLIL